MKKLIVLLAASLLAGTALAADPAPILQLRLAQDTPAADFELMTMTNQSIQNSTHTLPVYVQKAVLLDQTALQSAREVTHKFTDQAGNKIKDNQIEIVFSTAGAEQFARVTSQNVGKKLAIIIHGQVISTPVIHMPITGGTAEISGNFSEATARKLAADINAACPK